MNHLKGGGRGYGDRLFWDIDFEQLVCGDRQGKYRQPGGTFGSARQM